MKRIFTTLFSVLLIAFFAFSSFAALAEDTAGESETETVDVAQVKEICARLPEDTDKIDLKHKDDILTIKKAYDRMSVDQQLELTAKERATIGASFNAFVPLLLTDITDRIEKLPENADKVDAAELKTLWEDYNLLTPDGRESLNPKLFKKLRNTVREVDSSLLSEEDIKAIEEEEQKAKEEAEKKKAEQAQAASVTFNVWEIVVLAILALVILFNIVMVVVVAVKIFSASKRA